MSANDSNFSVPILRDVDVLIVGATTGAASAALEIRRLGRSAMVVSEFSYLGEETAGTLNLWPGDLDQSDALVRELFPSEGNEPARPGHLKRTLDRALVAAQIPLMYLARPIALLRDDAGRVSGAVIASRTSLFAITCRAVIDATRFGVVARLSGTPLHTRAERPSGLAWTVFAKAAPAQWPGDVRQITPSLHQVLKKEGPQDYHAWRLTLDRSHLPDDVRSWEHAARAQLCDANLLVAADAFPIAPEQHFGATGKLGDTVNALSDDQLLAAPQVIALNGLLPVSLSATAALERADVQAALGRRVASIAVEAGGGHTARAEFQSSTGGNVDGAYRFAPVFLRRQLSSLAMPALAFPSLGKCDVAVAGGGTGGAPAAISAARTGAKTVLLDIQHALGGVGTVGLISTYWFGNKVGFTAELNEAVMQIDQTSRDKRGTAWNPEVKSAVYHRMLKAAGGAAWLGSYAFGVRMGGPRVNGLLVSTPWGTGLLEAGCVVDATGNADIAAAAGAPCRQIDKTHVAVQGTGLSPRVYPAVWYQNSDHTFIDENDPEGITHAFLHARAKYPDDFDTSSLVNSRERRQIIGEVEVSPLDIMAGRQFPDTIFTACSNFDTHGFIIHPLFMLASPDHKPVWANVPFRCMLPKTIDGVLVTGLGMSAHRDALPVIRMQADVQNQGFSAGMAAAESARLGCALRDLDIRALQQRLAEAGVIAADAVGAADSFPLPASAIHSAATGDLRAVMNVAVLLAHADQARSALEQIVSSDPDPARRVDAAAILGMSGETAGAEVLAHAIGDTAWDEGWNYRGMGQFGPSMSRLDALIIAAARTRSPLAAAPIAAKARQLTAASEFSHCRAVALACAALKSPELTRAIHALLQQPGVAGHVQTDSAPVIENANGNPIETQSRNDSLRELHLARGLYLAGDIDGLGEKTLSQYAVDLRGHYARHARAVLQGGASVDDINAIA